ncbi:hypothetical protein [Flagellimonas pacifica]|uniref:Uncharacterized protein n=1 Tax=Flagellimonas pacifica TaxID=1247520 RepID=A0A285N1R2_9FLAO|nr:hypothetical protein [Allomuricauda parva]SNZ01681.1 hypothetical protein SAMN06265377_3523 [Allomuricauda parva]
MTIAALALSSCTRSIGSETAFLKWLDNPKNGLVKKASANGFSFSLKFLPSEYLAYTELKKGNDEKGWNELLHDFESSMSVLFSIEHDMHGIDATNYDIQNMAAYKERINELNFGLKQHLFIKGSEGKKIRPVLTTFENNYEIGGKKTFYVVFPKTDEEQWKTESLDIVFDDPFLDTGISHFAFKKQHIDQIPTLEFIN